MRQPYRDDREVLQLRIEELRAEADALAELAAKGADARVRLVELHVELQRLERRLIDDADHVPSALSRRWVWMLRGGTVALLLTLIGFPFLSWATHPRSRVQPAKVGAEAIRGAVDLWQADGDEKVCPTLDVLVAARKLEANKTDDPWGTPYRIECADEDVRVWSNGKDRIAGTADDIADDFKPADIKRVASL